MPQNTFFSADWPAPSSVKTLITTRQGGYSQGNFSSLNLGLHVGDAPENVQKNRALVQKHVPLPLAYLNQTHSTTVCPAQEALGQIITADASIDRSAQAACVVMTADCLPVLFCDRAGSVVAAAHAGWRGLAQGILQHTVQAMNIDPQEILAYLAPAISQKAFEVGEDVWHAFCSLDPENQQAFRPSGVQKYHADLYFLARLILQKLGIRHIYGGERCTYTEKTHFFSYRRDGQTGRMASIIWLAP